MLVSPQHDMVAILSVDNYDHIAVILNAATNTI
jgi:hypothetical protein